MAQPAAPNVFKLRIKCLKSEDFNVEIASDATVDDLKQLIERDQKMDIAKQRLIYKGKVLKAGQKLLDYKIADGVVVHLIMRKEAVANPQNDEPNTQQQQSSNNTDNTANAAPFGATAISVAVMDSTGGAADMNSILNSVFSNLGANAPMNAQQLQAAMSNAPGVMNLRGLLNPGEDPDAPNDDDVSSVEGDATTTSTSRVLPELAPEYAVSNGRGGYSPVTLLPPVLRSCNAMNLELDRLQRNYNCDALGIADAVDENDGNNNNGDANVDVDVVDVAVDVDVIIDEVQLPLGQQQAQAAPPTQQQQQQRRHRRREYLSDLLDVWDRFNEIVNGDDALNTADMEMKGNGDDEDDGYPQSVMGYIESVFDDLVEFQNTIECGLNQSPPAEATQGAYAQENQDDDNDMQMSGNGDGAGAGAGGGNVGDNADAHAHANVDEQKTAPQAFTTEDKNALRDRAQSAGNMLVEIGTVFASLGHMMSKMNVHRQTPRNRLRVTGLHGLSHVVRTAVPVGVDITSFISHTAQPQAAPPQSNSGGATQPPPANASTTSDAANSGDGAENGSDLLSSVLDTFATTDEDSKQNDANDATTGRMEVDDGGNTAAPATNNNNNPMAALLNAFGGGGGGSGATNPLASLMSVFGGGAAAAASNSGQRQPSQPQSQSSQSQRNPLMLVHQTLQFVCDQVCASHVEECKQGNYSVLASYFNVLNSFVLNTVLRGDDTPMRRHETAMEYANGFGLFMISKFSAEKRDVIRSLTLSHFKNHTALLLDITLDSSSEQQFERTFVKWVKDVFCAWIYRLSLKYNNRLEGVKKTFVQILMSFIKSNQSSSSCASIVPLIPPYVSYFVDEAKAYHLKQMQQQHLNTASSSSTTSNAHAKTSAQSSSTSAVASSSFSQSTAYLNEQWINNVQESERDRWLQTIRCDQKRLKQCIQSMKRHQFSDSYLAPSNSNSKEQEKKQKK